VISFQTCNVKIVEKKYKKQKMEKILGIDLGTNSIGWAIRDTSETDNQIIDKGVLTFDKGVGEEKGIEVPKVKARTAARGKRHNYQAEKYRKYNLLETLIENKMCPLTIEELNAWRHYKKGIGRRYPQRKEFIEWLRFDFDGNGKPDFERFGLSKHESYYVFRAFVIDENKKEIFKKEPHIIGRVLYQIVQRRGYNNIYNLTDDDKEKLSGTIENGGGDSGAEGVKNIRPFIEKHKGLGAALYYLQKETNERIRKRYNLRSYFEQEIDLICQVQNIEHLKEDIKKAIVWQRPLQSQKGLVGFCTLDRPLKSKTGKYYKKGSKRIPLSHPIYEEFRTWVDINNLKLEAPSGVNLNDFIEENVLPIFNKATDFHYSNKMDKKGKETKGLRDKIEKLGGKIHAKFDLELAEETDGKKYKANKFLNKIEKLFGNNWKEILRWKETLNNILKPKNAGYLRVEDIWHLLYDANITKGQKNIGEKIMPILQKHFPSIAFDINDFKSITLDKGYASLSEQTIKCILPYLKQGMLYSHAVFVANLEKVFQKKLDTETLAKLKEDYSKINDYIKASKEINNIINGLISDSYNEQNYSKGKNYNLSDIDINDINQKIKDNFKSKIWNQKTKAEKELFVDDIKKKYEYFLQQDIHGTDKGRQFYKTERIADKLRELLISKYDVDEKSIDKNIWHPSEQEVYSPAYIKADKDGVIITDGNGKDIYFLGDPNPISRGFKNPMAIKTLQYLKKLLNYLLETGKIDSSTKINLEIARELNDANTRAAIQKYNGYRKTLRDNIIKDIKEYYVNEKLSNVNISEELIQRYELWKEQKEKCMYCTKHIECAEVFNGKAQVEHTIPQGISHCNEMFNLTLAHVHCNDTKAKRFPTQWTDNYDLIHKNVGFMYAKYIEHKEKHEDTFKKAKSASDKAAKDTIIKERHYQKRHLIYWKKKYETFIIEEVTNQFRRQQLTDTQVITKYALPYLKTVFKRVEVLKGIDTAMFRKIYQINTEVENKDRTKHSHHAIDAAVLTLIPPSSIKEFIRKEYHQAKENNLPYTNTPMHWQNYNSKYIRDIEDKVIINFQPQYRTLTPTSKKVRKRGEIKIFKNEEGNKMIRKSQGDTIRGQLHDDTFFGAIKQPIYNEVNGKFIPKTDGKGNFIFQKNDKRKDDLFFVTRHREGLAYLKSFEDIEEMVIDPNLKAYLKKEIQNRIDIGQTFEKALLEPIWAFGKKQDKNGNSLNPIRHLRTRIRAGGGLIENPANVRERKNFISEAEYKNQYYASNGGIVACGLYELEIEGKLIRETQIFSILEVSHTKKARDINQAIPVNFEKTIKKKKHLIPLFAALKPRQKVLFYKNDINELDDLNENDILKRLYTIIGFDDGKIYFKHHLNAMNDAELKHELERIGIPKKGASKFNFDFPIPKLSFTKDNFNFAIEGKHFEIKLDGKIEWKKND
jgi:CRISPR-associated endonuclease Csn1